MAIEFFNNGTHRCVEFNDLAGEGDVQANQNLIINGNKGMLLDPGGNKLFSKLPAEMSRFLPPQMLEYIFLSHQDPDVGAGLNGYLLITDAVICYSAVWERFIPAFCTKSLATNRVMVIPDEGTRLTLGDAELIFVPAHFLHSPGNFQLYDTVSRTLFSGDLGAAVLPPTVSYTSVKDFTLHLQFMEGFHQRYMSGSIACVKWAEMIRDLDIQRIVPQHGPMFEGKEIVKRFIDWVATLQCGPEVVAKRGIYSIPQRQIAVVH